MFGFIKKLFGFGLTEKEVIEIAAPYKIETPPVEVPAVKAVEQSANKKPRGRRPQGNKTQATPVEQTVPVAPKKPRAKRQYRSPKPTA